MVGKGLVQNIVVMFLFKTVLLQVGHRTSPSALHLHRLQGAVRRLPSIARWEKMRSTV